MFHNTFSLSLLLVATSSINLYDSHPKSHHLQNSRNGAHPRGSPLQDVRKSLKFATDVQHRSNGHHATAQLPRRTSCFARRCSSRAMCCAARKRLSSVCAESVTAASAAPTWESRPQIGSALGNAALLAGLPEVSYCRVTDCELLWELPQLDHP